MRAKMPGVYETKVANVGYQIKQINHYNSIT